MNLNDAGDHEVSILVSENDLEGQQVKAPSTSNYAKITPLVLSFMMGIGLTVC